MVARPVADDGPLITEGTAPDLPGRPYRGGCVNGSSPCNRASSQPLAVVCRRPACTAPGL